VVENPKPAIFSSLAPLSDMQTVLPPHRSIFTPVPDKPPLQYAAALEFLTSVSNFELPLEIDLPKTATPDVPEWVPRKTFSIRQFARRPLECLKLRQRISPRHSIIMLVDGLLFACFRVRLERDVCATSKNESFYNQFGTGMSPASTYCGLFLPHQQDLFNVLRAVEYERG
jgi:hypothetical protein